MRAPLRVLVADDELMARKRLLRLLSYLPDVEVCGECKDGTEVLQRVAAGGADVVLLDISMPGLSGMEALRLMPEDGPYVVFCTAHAEHAVEAFDAGALDYLLKPIEGERLEKALRRARSRDAQRRFRDEAQRQRVPARAPIDRLAIPTRNGIVLVSPSQVSHAVLDGELVTLATAQGEFLTDLSLQELEERLPACFMRVHRRALLNLEQTVRLEPADTGGFLARTARGDGVVVSRQAARELRRMLGLRKGPGEDGEDRGGEGD
ncbi:MAG: response regulator [Deltaproteobacteria bacterium]|nr:response regulator [Deltaproteobacteria bacterium]